MIDRSTILYILPKPGGREAVLLRRLFSQGTARLEITLAGVTPGGGYHALRGVGIGPDLLKAFAEAAPAAVGAVLAAGASANTPNARHGTSRGAQSKATADEPRRALQRLG